MCYSGRIHNQEVFQMACYPRIRKLRENANLSPKMLAESLGIHWEIYACYEDGVCDPPLDFLYDLSEFYNLSSDYILGLINTPTPLKGKRPQEDPKQYGRDQRQRPQGGASPEPRTAVILARTDHKVSAKK